jgi:hypothetical protein
VLFAAKTFRGISKAEKRGEKKEVKQEGRSRKTEVIKRRK